MNIVILIINLTLLLVSILPVNSSINIKITNTNHLLRNTSLRLIILTKKTSPKCIQEFKDFYTVCYTKVIASINKKLIEYNSLSEEDRTLIETIISLCY